jgi:ZIP family zinc transporter/zinc and cadmium transporter
MGFGEILLYSTLAGLSAVIGSAIVLYYEDWARRNSAFLISFAAGVMLTIAFMNLVPEAQQLNERAWLLIFLGFLLLYFVQHLIMFHPSHEASPETSRNMLSSVGLTIHSLLDGIVISIGFEADWTLGLLTTAAVMLHKIPDGITITGILLHGRTTRRKTLLISAVVALATPLGAIAAYFFLRDISRETLGVFLSLTAGSFIYLAATDLLPEARQSHRHANALFFFTGVAAIVSIGYFLH